MLGHKQKPWEARWVRLRHLGGGGQGETCVVTDSHIKDGATNYVLKILKNQRDPDRRARMYREVAALASLKHNGIPKVIESNAHHFENPDVPLYIVSEYIDGLTVADRLIRAIVSWHEAVSHVIGLLDIVDFCHNRGVIHRDIKPENIICRDGSLERPVLIDFGLSFNRDDDSLLTITETHQQLGNRFLALPELRSFGGPKRDERSDITLCCGILIYLLTRCPPVDLLDGEGAKPHQRAQWKDTARQLPRQIISQLSNLFDIAFEVPVDRRWQSVKAVRDRLWGLQDSANEGVAVDIETSLARFKNETQNSPDYVKKNETGRLFQKTSEEIRTATRDIVARLGMGFGTIQSGSGIDFKTLTFGDRFGVTSDLVGKQFWPEYKGIITGSELVVTASVDGITTELLRSPLLGPIPWAEFRTAIEEYLLKGVLAL